MLLLLPTPAEAQAGGAPQPPCAETAPYPAFPDPDAPPAIEVLSGAELPRGWRPPRCAAWPETAYDIVVGLAGAFRSTEDMDELLARVGAVSATRGLRYWSVSEKGWRVLIEDAFALDGPALGGRRADFAPGEMTDGAELYFAQKDNRSSAPVVYRMRVLEASAERAMVAIENVSQVRLYVVTLFDPGDLQSVYVLERLAPDVWGWYSLGGVTGGASPLALGRPASYANRAAALYRHVAGIPADREPPAAP